MSGIELKVNGTSENEDVDFTRGIEVKPPYFALKHLRRHADATVSAEIEPEQPLYDELGPMSGAEIGRHLAIIGSCALSAINPKTGQHYYLAQRAEYRAHPLPQNCSDETTFGVSATEPEISGRGGRVMTSVATRAGEPLVSLDVEYLVMSARMFDKLFAARRHASNVVDPTAYQKYVDFPAHNIRADRLSAVIESVPHESCAGHFEHYACIPVAVLMGWLSRAAGKLLAYRRGVESIKFRVERATVSADRLAFADQSVYLDVQVRSDPSDGSETFMCAANDADGNPFGTMEAVLSTVNPS